MNIDFHAPSLSLGLSLLLSLDAIHKLLLTALVIDWKFPKHRFLI